MFQCLQVTYRRMKDTLIQLSKGVIKGPAADLVPVLFGERPPAVSKKDVTLTPFNSNLDHSQVFQHKYVSFCSEIYCVQYIYLHVASNCKQFIITFGIFMLCPHGKVLS